MKYKVDKTVIDGDHFIEHSFKQYPENFVGLWKKVGQKIEINEGNKRFLCQYCLRDFQCRKKNEITIGDKLYSAADRSYQVPGITKNYQKYEWDFGLCSNPRFCWGPSERLFEVKRKGNLFLYSNFKMKTSPYEELTDRMYMRFERRGLWNDQFHTGINSVSMQPKFLFPDIVSHTPGSSYYVHCESRIREKLPPHMSSYYDRSFEAWPDVYNTPAYIFPLTMTFNHYLMTKGLPFPKTEYELRQNHFKVAMTYLDLYPGGAGFRASQYRFVHNENLDEDSRTPAREADWVKSWHLNEEDAYIEGQQDGFVGPIISYWGRIHCLNKFFPGN